MAPGGYFSIRNQMRSFSMQDSARARFPQYSRQYPIKIVRGTGRQEPSKTNLARMRNPTNPPVAEPTGNSKERMGRPSRRDRRKLAVVDRNETGTGSAFLQEWALQHQFCQSSALGQDLAAAKIGHAIATMRFNLLAVAMRGPFAGGGRKNAPSQLRRSNGPSLAFPCPGPLAPHLRPRTCDLEPPGCRREWPSTGASRGEERR